jgi:hypothetical protein
MTIESEPLEGRRALGEAASRVQAELTSYWTDMLANESERQQVANLLGLPEATVAQFADPPLHLDSAQSNAAGADIGLIVMTWVATEVVLGAFKDLAREEVKRRLKLLWAYVSEKIDERLGGNATGWPAVLPPEVTALLRSGPADARDASPQ